MMNLFEDIEIENEKYINVLDALDLIAEKINYDVSDIARRLLLDNFNQIACMFKINDYGKIELWCSEKEFNGDYSSTTEFLKVAISTSGTFEYTQEDTWGNEYEYTKDIWLDNYWLKSDFFEFDTIKKLKILENDLEEFLKARTQEAITDLFVRHDINKHSELTKKNVVDISQKFLREQKEFESNEDLEESTPDIPLFYLNDTFSLIEASCLISGDDPIQMNRCTHDTNFDQNYPDFNEAYSFICSAVQAGRFAGDLILANDLKSYLRSKGKIIDGFNDQLKNEVTEQNLDNQNSIINQLKKENERLKQLLQKNEGESVELAIDLKASENTLNRITTKNEELKAELLEKEQKIKELESLPQKDDKDLISLIFDESATNRYAPDLVLSIKLWEHIYITHPKSDSHTNKAIKWLENNTGYEVNKKAGSASKIREITTPFLSWGNLRDKKHSKKT